MKSYFSDPVVVDALYCQEEEERVLRIEWDVRPELVRQFKSNKVSSTAVKSELVRLKLISTNSTYKIIQVELNQKQSRNRPKIIVELNLIEHPTCPVLTACRWSAMSIW